MLQASQRTPFKPYTTLYPWRHQALEEQASATFVADAPVAIWSSIPEDFFLELDSGLRNSETPQFLDNP